MSDLKHNVEQLKQDCKELRESVNQVLDAGAREKTILILMSHYTKLPQKTIKTVMDGLHDLELEYFEQPDS